MASERAFPTTRASREALEVALSELRSLPKTTRASARAVRATDARATDEPRRDDDDDATNRREAGRRRLTTTTTTTTRASSTNEGRCTKSAVICIF